MAIEQLSKESRGRYDENAGDLTDAHSEGRFAEIYKKYPNSIIKDSMNESIAQYYFHYKESNVNRTHFIDFTKDANGDWKMDNL